MNENFYYESPIGVLEIRTTNSKITGLKIVNEIKNDEKSCFDYLSIKTQLDEYFSGSRTIFDLNISLEGTDFQKRVWEELLKIPYGQVKTYKEVAKLVGSPMAQRAVGSACNKNPILLLIPCHRVISKTGSLTGFVCGIDRKEFLLKLENAL